MIYALVITHFGPGSEAVTAFAEWNVLLEFPSTDIIHANNSACNVELQNESLIVRSVRLVLFFSMYCQPKSSTAFIA